MKLEGKLKKEFEQIVKPLIKFLNDNCHPHAVVVVSCTDAELSEGIYNFHTEEYLRN